MYTFAGIGYLRSAFRLRRLRYGAWCSQATRQSTCRICLGGSSLAVFRTSPSGPGTRGTRGIGGTRSWPASTCTSRWYSPPTPTPGRSLRLPLPVIFISLCIVRSYFHFVVSCRLSQLYIVPALAFVCFFAIIPGDLLYLAWHAHFPMILNCACTLASARVGVSV